MAERKERKVGRPTKGESRTVEPRVRNRAPVGGFRDKLTVYNQDPDYVYRWVLAYDDNGARIIEMQARGYELAPSEGHIIGQNHVYKTEDGSSIVKVPAGKDGGFLYLMRIKKEWYEEDQREKSKSVIDEYQAVRNYKETENSGGQTGVYGSVEFS